MTEAAIRPVRPDEAEAIRALTLRSKAHWGYDAAYLADWADALDVGPDFLRASVSFAAEEGGALAGYYSLLFEPEAVPMNTGAAGPGWWLDNLFVEPAQMGTGLGGLLYRHAAAQVQARGGTALYLLSDARAAGFYAHMGGRQIGEMASIVPRVVLPVFRHGLPGTGPE